MRNAQSRVKLVETERSSPPSKEAEKFFGDFLSRKSRPCGEQEKMQSAKCKIAGKACGNGKKQSAEKGRPRVVSQNKKNRKVLLILGSLER